MRPKAESIVASWESRENNLEFKLIFLFQISIPMISLTSGALENSHGLNGIMDVYALSYKFLYFEFSYFIKL